LSLNAVFPEGFMFPGTMRAARFVRNQFFKIHILNMAATDSSQEGTK
jgi:hypothetical protein